MTFGKLKRLLIAEEVVPPACADTDIRNHIFAQLDVRDQGIRAKPLKYQMAWIVKQLDLHETSRSGTKDILEKGHKTFTAAAPKMKTNPTKKKPTQPTSTLTTRLKVVRRDSGSSSIASTSSTSSMRNPLRKGQTTSPRVNGTSHRSNPRRTSSRSPGSSGRSGSMALNTRKYKAKEEEAKTAMATNAAKAEKITPQWNARRHPAKTKAGAVTTPGTPPGKRSKCEPLGRGKIVAGPKASQRTVVASAKSWRPATKHGISMEKKLEKEKVVKLEDKAVASAVAWRRILAFLRESSQGAKSVESLFSAMDSDGNRFLDFAELMTGLRRVGVALTNEMVTAFQNDVDVNRDSKVSLAEFSSAVQERSIASAKKEQSGWASILGGLLPKGPPKGGAGEGGAGSPLAAFRATDSDGNGTLDLRELSKTLERMGVAMGKVEAALFFDSVDTKGDGTISFDEFKAIFDQEHASATDLTWAAFLRFMLGQGKGADLGSQLLELFFDELDARELGGALRKLGLDLTGLQLQLLCQDMDLNVDGAVSFEELARCAMAKARALNIMGPGLDVFKQADGRSGGDRGIESTGPAAVKAASLAVCWRRILSFLRQSAEGAASVEELFTAPDGQAGVRALSKEELSSGLLRVGLKLDEEMLSAFHRELDANQDGRITLDEFSAQVGVKSQELAAEEIDAWSGAIAVLLGGAPTEAGQVEVGGLSPIERLETAFRAADKDGSGGLNTGELLELLLALGVRMSPTQAGILKEGFDVNSDGVISLDEFKQMFDQNHATTIDVAWSAFLFFLTENPSKASSLEALFFRPDSTLEGSLDLAELSQGLAHLGLGLGPAQLRLFRDDLDVNGDGRISYNEFAQRVKDKMGDLAMEHERDLFKFRPRPGMVDVTTSTVAWNRIASFLRENASGADSIKALFVSMDLNSNASLDCSELRAGLLRLGTRLEGPLLDAIFMELDLDRDGRISAWEFEAKLAEKVEALNASDREVWADVLSAMLPSCGPEEATGASAPEEDPIARVEAAFRYADADGNGTLDLGELTRVLTACGVQMGTLEVALFKDSLDTNGNGAISLDEFKEVFDDKHSRLTDMTWAVFLNALAEGPTAARSLEALFQRADRDGNAVLDLDELAAAFSGLKIALSPLQLRLLRDDLDVNGDGVVSYKELSDKIESKRVVPGDQAKEEPSGVRNSGADSDAA